MLKIKKDKITIGCGEGFTTVYMVVNNGFGYRYGENNGDGFGDGWNDEWIDTYYVDSLEGFGWANSAEWLDCE